MKIPTLFIFIITLTIVTMGIITSSKVQSLQVDVTCKDIELVFARGSGQELQDNESKRFFGQVTQRLQGGAVAVNPYELGTETYGNAKYQAITVGQWWKNGNIFGASISAGYANDYGRSVDSGVGELYNYLTQRYAKCPDARIVLGGYSQGAQVIGQTLPKFSTELRSKIDFVALFGDPKLHLPEGEGIYPDACRGKNLSSWRRGIGDCHTDNGSLGARKPFLPASMTDKTGLWCKAVDFVCGTSKFVYDINGHGEYKAPGSSIDWAAREIAQRLKVSLTPEKAVAIDAESYPYIPQVDYLRSTDTQPRAKTAKYIVGHSNRTVRPANNLPRPIALLKNIEYSALPGQEVTFDASDSYAVGTAITAYRWDFDGDGVFEQTTTEPISSYTYPVLFDGRVQVRVLTSNNTTGDASAIVKIGTKIQPVAPSAPSNLTATVKSTQANLSTVALSWTPSDTLASSWVVSVDGVALGTITGDRTTIDVTDVIRGADVEISVTGLLGDGTLGESATTVVAKYVEPPVAEPTKPASNWRSLLIELLRKIVVRWMYFTYR